jgi:hypothetical protein
MKNVISKNALVVALIISISRLAMAAETFSSAEPLETIRTLPTASEAEISATTAVPAIELPDKLNTIIEKPNSGPDVKIYNFFAWRKQNIMLDLTAIPVTSSWHIQSRSNGEWTTEVPGPHG